MDFVLIVQQLANGLIIGVGYSLVALGLTMVFGILDIINFAHGEFYMLGAFMAYLVMSSMNFGYIEGGVVAVTIVVIIGLLTEFISVRPLIERDKPMTLLATYAVSILFMNLIEITLGNTPQAINSPYSVPIQIGPFTVTQQRIIVFGMGVLLFVLLGLFLKYTITGKLIRATAQNKKASELVGINIKGIYRLTFAIGSGFAAVAGVLLAPLSSIFPAMGQVIVIKSFVIIILGSLGSIPGAIIGGMFIGVIEALSGGFISSAWKDLFSYSILIIVLLIRPQGLFAKKG